MMNLVYRILFGAVVVLFSSALITACLWIVVILFSSFPAYPVLMGISAFLLLSYLVGFISDTMA